jgi:RNA polymerase-binding transcription factor DksA
VPSTVAKASKNSQAKISTANSKSASSRNVTKKSATKTTGTATTAPVVSETAGAVAVSSPAAKAAKSALPIAPKPGLRYSDKDLKEFKDQIVKEREVALEELRMLRERLDDLTNSEAAEESAIYSMHMAEQGSEAIEKEKTYAQITRIQDYLRKLDEAMHRIDDKSYGICKMCGILIAKERLLAVPITTLSASYKIHKTCPADGIDRIVAKPIEKNR